jgi:hypothetical protein
MLQANCVKLDASVSILALHHCKRLDRAHGFQHPRNSGQSKKLRLGKFLAAVIFHLEQTHIDS